MGTNWQHIVIPVPKGLDPTEREALAQVFIDYIVNRAQDGNAGKGGKALPAYSDEYVRSLAFHNAGKSKSDVNMTLTGDMLASIELLSNRSGSINIGFQKGSAENAKADGNIRGTYGQNKQVGPKRDFLGLTKAEIDSIQREFKSKLAKNPDYAEEVLAAVAAGDSIAEGVDTEDLG